jgi:hypothetical protein
MVALVGLRAHFGRDDLARFDGGAVVNGHDADGVGRARRLERPFLHLALDAHDDGREAALTRELALPVRVLVGVGHGPRVDAVLGHDHEERQVDGVNTFTQDRALTPALAAVLEERRRVLEERRARALRESLGGRQGRAVTRVHVADASLGNDDERLAMDAVLPREVPEVQTAAQDLGLEAGLAGGGHDPAIEKRALSRPELLDDADARVGDVADASEPREQRERRHGAEDPGDEVDQCVGHGASRIARVVPRARVAARYRLAIAG